ncbi:MAG: biotin--[acetyl-CoA-carboxylase] ligase [Pseudomonadota bacterium]
MSSFALPKSLQGYTHQHFGTLGSTNTWLLEQAVAGHEGNHWVTAETQTMGKGSRGRSWTGTTGNLFASLLLLNPSVPSKFHELTFVAALALQSAMVKAGLAQTRISLKWPNDVLIDGKKCSGVLLEGSSLPSNPHVVIGIGVNCASFPLQTLHPATSLSACGLDISAGEFFGLLAQAMGEQLGIWDKGQGFASTRQEWLEHAARLGELVSVQIPGHAKKDGRFVSIDDKGYMLLETETGAMERISTADVFFAAPQAGGT